MAIEVKASHTEKHSPFFIAHQQMVKEWELFAEKVNGRSSGDFNAWCINLDLEAEDLRISASRQLTTVTANVIPLDARYQETFVARMSNKGSKEMSIELRTMLNFFKRFLPGYGILALDDRYLVKPQISLDTSTRYLIDLLIQYDLRRMKVEQNEVLVELGMFPKNAAILQDIVDGLTKWISDPAKCK